MLCDVCSKVLLCDVCNKALLCNVSIMKRNAVSGALSLVRRTKVHETEARAGRCKGKPPQTGTAVIEELGCAAAIKLLPKPTPLELQRPSFSAVWLRSLAFLAFNTFSLCCVSLPAAKAGASAVTFRRHYALRADANARPFRRHNAAESDASGTRRRRDAGAADASAAFGRGRRHLRNNRSRSVCSNYGNWAC